MGFWKTKKRSDERIWQQIVVGANWAGISNLQGRCSGKVRPCYNRSTSIIERKLNGAKCRYWRTSSANGRK